MFYESLLLMKTNSKASGETVRMHRLAWNFAVCICHKAHFPTTWFKSPTSSLKYEHACPSPHMHTHACTHKCAHTHANTLTKSCTCIHYLQTMKDKNNDRSSEELFHRSRTTFWDGWDTDDVRPSGHAPTPWRSIFVPFHHSRRHPLWHKPV